MNIESARAYLDNTALAEALEKSGNGHIFGCHVKDFPLCPHITLSGKALRNGLPQDLASMVTILSVKVEVKPSSTSGMRVSGKYVHPESDKTIAYVEPCGNESFYWHYTLVIEGFDINRIDELGDMIMGGQIRPILDHSASQKEAAPAADGE